jgi:hypothetical protein
MTARRAAGALAALIVALAAPLSARQAASREVAEILHRAGERVTEYFARAQSLICLEKVALQKLNLGWSAEGPARLVESELRLSWEPTPENPVPKEATTLRQVVRVNGSKPRKNDYDNCTTPEQNDTEEQPLSLLLPEQREKYTFSFEKHEQIDGRAAFVIAFREIGKPKVDVSLVEDKEDCVSFDIEGGTRGRIWIDASTYDVLRLDSGLVGLVTIPLPRKAARRPGVEPYWTAERIDTTIRFKRVSFQDPEETLVLPITSSTLQVIRGTSRLRTSTQYVAYRRFMTGGRIIPQR